MTPGPAPPEGADALPRHTARCHCGAVRFAFASDIERGTRCNCSYCLRKGALHHRVTNGSFELLGGEDSLRLYQFGTFRARHYFCGVCGIHTHCNPRSAPHQVNVNLHCVEGVDALLSSITLADFDGRNWAL